MKMSKPLYVTEHGKAYFGDAIDVMRDLAEESVDLVITSPPFALQREKEYGNVRQEAYVDWLLQFSSPVAGLLEKTGSYVIDLGGAYQQGKPIRSLHNFKYLLRMCEELGWYLSEEFFWYNPSKLPSPIEWVNKRKIRVKDAVNTIWWFSRSPFPKADIRKVLVPYSDRMKLLLNNSSKYYSPKKRPSGHDISARFSEDNGGAIPSNLLQIPNTESNSSYLRRCQSIGIEGHPARFPEKLPQFFINLLTDEGDTVLDIFAGSNTTGMTAEKLNRKWIAIDNCRPYLAASALRFVDSDEPDRLKAVYSKLMTGEPSAIRVEPEHRQSSFVLAEKASKWKTLSRRHGKRIPGGARK